MKLAYDFTSAVKPEGTGTARYAVELLRAILRRLGPEDRVILGYRLSRYGQRAHAPRFDDPRVKVRPLQSPFAFLTYGPCDLFHGLGVNVPRGLMCQVRFVTIHGIVDAAAVGEGRQEKLARRHAKIARMLGRATRAFVVSEFERGRTVAATGCAPDKLIVVPHGVDHGRFHPSVDKERDLRSLGVSAPRRPFLLCVGAITGLKNVEALVKAYARSRARAEFDLVLAGPLRRESEPILTRITEMGLGSQVCLPGHVNPDAVSAWMGAARALIHPSRYESFGLPVLEAMASGIPVACSDAGALSEVAGGAARLFDPTDLDAITDAIDAVTLDIELRKQLTGRGLARAREFTWDRAATRTLDTYREVLGARAVHGGARLTPMSAEPARTPTARRTPRVEEVPCPLCGAKDASPRWSGHDRLTGVPGEYRVVECDRCGFLYQSPRPALDDLHLCYPGDYAAFNPSVGEGHKLLRGSSLDVDANKYVLATQLGYRHLTPDRTGIAVRALALWNARRVRKLVFPMRGQGRMLDVGCSTGARMSSMKSLGWKVSGIENSPAAAAAARREHDNVFAGDILDATFPDSAFDMVTCFHVLEHVPYPRQVMSRMIRWLAPGGVLVVEVPNGASIGAAFFGTYWYLLDLPRHFHQFTPRTLTRLAEESGGVVREMEHHDSLGTWLGSLDFWDTERARQQGRQPRGLVRRKWMKKLLRPFGHAARFAKRGEILRAFIERAERDVKPAISPTS